jgi:hypothetical protein
MLKIVVLLVWFICLTSDLHAAPRAEAWDYWNTSLNNQTVEIDHSPWQVFLDRYLEIPEDGISRVRYSAVTEEDRISVNNYLEHLQRLPVKQMTRNQQLAYWINLYNVGTVNVILNHYPVDSILDIDISPGLFSNGPWGKKLFTIDNQSLSLDDIEHRILRPLWKDPRIHYAVNCASLGCPSLLEIAFTHANVQQLLDQAAANFINHPRGVRVDQGRLVVSSIYHWFKTDFGKDDKGVIEHLMTHAKTPLKKMLEGIIEIDGHAYDWALNQSD